MSDINIKVSHNAKTTQNTLGFASFSKPFVLYQDKRTPGCQSAHKSMIVPFTLIFFFNYAIIYLLV